jgi:nucleoside-diphosphate-sugar epimerase
MRILITGGTGFIGSRVVQQLAAREGLDLVVLSRGGDLSRLHACGALAGRSPVRVAIGDFAGAGAAGIVRDVQPEVVIHLSMVYHTLGSAGGATVDAVNFQGTVDLFEAFLAAGGRRFVTAGTCFEYGHHDAERISEEALCRPIYDYAVAKARATDAILARGVAADTEALVLRVFAPYGPLEDPKRIVPQLLDAARTGRLLELTPGMQVRDYVYVEDVAGAFTAAAMQPLLLRRQAVYNVCTGTGHTLRELAAQIEQATDRRLDLVWGRLPYRPNEMMQLVGCNERIAAELGWRPDHDLAAGLRRTAGVPVVAMARAA